MTFSNIDHRPSTWPNSLPTCLCDGTSVYVSLWHLLQVLGHIEGSWVWYGSSPASDCDSLDWTGQRFGTYSNDTFEISIQGVHVLENLL